MSVKITSIQLENVKRVKAVKLQPAPSGLTIIGGRNRQGKTSALDGIIWTLGGDRYRPKNAHRDGSVTPPWTKIRLSNGLVVERRGKNSSLVVTDPSGQRAGQTLLNSFIGEFAIDLPRFLDASTSEKAQTLLRIIGVGDQLAELEKQEKELYQERLTTGRIADQKAKFAKEQPYYADAPKDLVSASDLIKRQQEILARNGENQRKRERVRQIETDIQQQYETVKIRESAVEELKRKLLEAEEQLSAAQDKLTELNTDLETARKTAAELQDESTAELERSIADIEEINRKVRANLDKDKAEEDAKYYSNLYAELTEKIEAVRKQKTDLLEGANLPYPGLSVEDGELTYQGKTWDDMAASDQLIVSTSIARQLKPECGFVLLDKLEQMDLETLEEFGAWLEAENLQVIATRVSTGEECQIIIEDGYAVGQEDTPATESEQPEEPAPSETPSWKAGQF